MIKKGWDSPYQRNMAFKGKREDHNLAEHLQKGQMPLNKNQQRLIDKAIENLAKDSSEKNVSFLLSTAENLNYGIKENSQLNQILNTDSPIAGKKKVNNDWEEKLRKAARQAIEASKPENRNALEQEYKRIFVEPRPLTPQEQELLELRKEILQSEELKSATSSPQKLAEASKISKNLDYFIASSEVPMEQKKACLEKIRHFVSPEYKINSQLTDKKTKVLSEIMNDLVVKTPEAEMLAIKEVNQKRHGMCAAISICRKALAYEDKATYIDNVMSELDNKPEMMVFDVVKLGEKAKVPVKKTHIDFNEALKKDYRIIDASALQWMHISGTIGDGSVAVEKYTAFDPDNYSLFNDSKWYKDLPEEHLPDQQLLRTLIKAKEINKDFEKTKLLNTIEADELKANRPEYESTIKKANDTLQQYVKELLPNENSKTHRDITNGILGLEKNKDKNFMIHPREEAFSKKQKIAAFIKSRMPKVNDNELKTQTEKIYGVYQLSKETDKKLSAVKANNHPRVKAAYYNELFSVASAHRKVIETDLDRPGRIEDFYGYLNLPDRQAQVTIHLNQLADDINKKADNTTLQTLAKQLNTDPSKESVLNAVAEMRNEAEHQLPAKLDDIYSRMSMVSRKAVLQNIIGSAKQNVLAGDERELAVCASNFHIKPEKKTILKHLNELSKELEKDVPESRITVISGKLGIKDQLTLAKESYASLAQAMANGLTEESLNHLAKNLGVEPKPENIVEAMEKVASDLESVATRYKEIETASGMPSAKDTILQKLEKKGDILPRRALNSMQQKFNDMSKFHETQTIADRQGQKLRNPEIYKFSQDHLEQFKKVEKNFNNIRKYADRHYQFVNDKLGPMLDELYGETGQEKGHFWLSEEGHSGLFSGEQIRIFEQMTGRPYHAESDILKAAEKIKSGQGSGISGTNVSANEYSGHAQYIADISPVEVTDPLTGKKTVKDVLWHDNSWGPAEKDRSWKTGKGSWKDATGLERTGYGKSYGGPKGYILDSEYKTGTLVEEMNTGIGVHKADMVDNPRLKKFSDGAGEKYPMFRDVILPGEDPKSFQKTYELLETVFEKHAGGEDIDALTNHLLQGGKVDWKKLEGLEAAAAAKEEKLMALIKGRDGIEGVKGISGIETIDDFKKLPEDSMLKLILRKMALTEHIVDPNHYTAVYNAKDMATLDKIQGKIVESSKDVIRDVFNKTPRTFSYIETLSEGQILRKLDKLEKEEGINLAQLKKAVPQIFKVPKNKLDGTINTFKEELNKNAIEALSSRIADEVVREKARTILCPALSDAVDSALNLNSVDEMKRKVHNADGIAKWIDTKFDPADNEEFIQVYKKLQAMDKENFEKLLADSKPEDIGIKFTEPFEYIKKIRAENYQTEKTFNETVFSHVSSHELKQEKSQKLGIQLKSLGGSNTQKLAANAEKSPETLYRATYVKLEELDVDKYIRKFKAQAFEKYGVRPAFPKIELSSPEELRECAQKNLEIINSRIVDVDSYRNAISLYEASDKLDNIINSNQTSAANDVKAAVKPILEEMYGISKNDDSLKDFKKATSSLLKAVNSFEGELPYSKVASHLEGLQAYINDLKQAAPIDQLVATHDSYKKGVKTQVNMFVSTNIQPRYQSKVAGMINDWIKVQVKNPESPKATDLYNGLIHEIENKHILHTPLEILHEIVKHTDKETVAKAPEVETSIVKTLKYYLERCVTAADSAKIEYRLVKNTDKGIATNTKNLLNLFTVPNRFGEMVSLDSAYGIKYLMAKLSDPVNNNRTLKLFFEQTGLTEKAAQSMMKGSAPEKFTTLFKAFENTVERSIRDSRKIESQTNVTARNLAKAQNGSLAAIFDNHLKNIDASFAKANIKNSKVLNLYKDSIGEMMKQVAPEASQNPKMLFEALHEQAMVNVDNYMSQIFNHINGESEYLIEKGKLLNSLKISEFSSVFKDREAYMKKLLNAIDLTQDSIKKINKIVMRR